VNEASAGCDDVKLILVMGGLHILTLRREPAQLHRAVFQQQRGKPAGGRRRRSSFCCRNQGADSDLRHTVIVS
jgi:hypothetical protein